MATFNTTPYGTGGGIWESGAGLASGTAVVNSQTNTYLFVATANGTFDANSTSAPNTEYGDSLLRLKVYASGALSVDDYFTPSDQATRCANDIDLGSGSVMLLPDAFYSGHNDLMVSADKETRLFVADRDNLTHFHSGGDQIVQEVVTPTNVNQGYYSNPAYWKWIDGQGTHRAVYYGVRAPDNDHINPPLSLNMYVLNPSSGPIPSTPSNGTGTLFCGYGATPSISANGTSGGILWAIETRNLHSPILCDSPNWKPAVLTCV